MRIDFHTHAFPDKLAPSAIDGLAKASGYRPETDGTVRGLIAKMDEWGVDLAVVANIAVTPRSEQKVNDFAIETNDMHRIAAFGSVHPASEHAIAELHRLKAAGIRGIKLHPEYQGFDIDDKAAYPIYEACNNLGLVVLFHAGWDVAYVSSRRAYPDKAISVIRDFPDLKIVLGHFGANRAIEETKALLVGTHAYFDLSLTNEYLTPDEVAAVIRAHGTDKILFGTDCPWGNPTVMEAFLTEMPLSDVEKEQIRYRNAAALLGLIV